MTESNLWHGGTHLQDYGRHVWITMLTWFYTFAGIWQTWLNYSGHLGSSIPWSHSQLWQFYVWQQEVGTEKQFLADATGLSKALRQPQGIHNMGSEIHENKAERNSHIADIFYCDTEQLFHQCCLFLQKTYVLPFPPSMKTNWTKLDWGELVSLSRETQLCTPRDNIHHHLTNHTSAVTFFGPSKTQEGACYTSTTNEQHLSGSATMQQQWHESPKPCSTLQTGCDKWLNMLKKGRVRVTGAPCHWWRWFHSRPCPPWPRGSGCHPARQTWTQKARQTGLTCHQERECSTHKSQAVPTHFKDSIIKYCFAAWKRGLPWKCACCILS